MVKINIKGPIVSSDTAWVYHYFGWDACGPKDVENGLKEANGEDVVLVINSPGGSCSAGYEIYTLLMGYEGNVTAHVIMAASAASLPVCAAKQALASDTCIFMIHNAQSIAQGDYRDMQMSADMLKEFNAGIINAYVRKTGRSREELQALMDSETYMSAQRAIENGFIDGYIFGSPDGADGQGNDDADAAQDRIMLDAVASVFPVITDSRAKEIMALLKTAVPQNAETAVPPGAAVPVLQNNSFETVSEINDNAGQDPEKGENKKMTLEEIYGEHPELKDEVDALVNDAKDEGADMERNRLEALDKISAGVTSEALHEAKYGKNRIDAKELAYQAMLKDGQKAKDYMADTIDDSQNSGAEDVGTGALEDTADESDEMAAYVNAKKGKR